VPERRLAQQEKAGGYRDGCGAGKAHDPDATAAWWRGDGGDGVGRH
jgi:hypothetical protein